MTQQQLLNALQLDALAAEKTNGDSMVLTAQKSVIISSITTLG